MMNQLRQRVFYAFAAGSTEELAAVLQLLLMFPTHNNKTSQQDLHFPPAWKRGIDAYTVEQVLAQTASPTFYQPIAESPYATTILRFGKYSKCRLDEVPADYLLWILENFEDLWLSTRRVIEQYLDSQC
jgi:hypothetical protein